MIPDEEVQRRIRAARILLDDMSQDEMARRGHEQFGLDKGELARIERGTKKIEVFHLKLLSEILEVPLSWFTEPRERVVQVPARSLDQALGELERWLRDQGSGAAGTG